MVVGGGKDDRGAAHLIGQKWLTGTAGLKASDMEVGPARVACKQKGSQVRVGTGLVGSAHLLKQETLTLAINARNSLSHSWL